MVCLYVDDITYMGSSKSLVADFKACMIKTFEMTDLGLLHYFFGLEAKQGAYGIFVSQQKYTMDLLKRHNMMGCNRVSTSMNVNEALRVEDGHGKANTRHFRSIVGGLNYLSHIWPDIAHYVNVVSSFTHSPSLDHLGAAKRILRYVAKTSDYGVWYSSVDNFRLQGFTDIDFASFVDDWKSTSDHVFFLSSRTVSWSSKK